MGHHRFFVCSHQSERIRKEVERSRRASLRVGAFSRFVSRIRAQRHREGTARGGNRRGWETRKGCYSRANARELFAFFPALRIKKS